MYGKGGAHQDDRNVTVRPMIGQINDSTIAYKSELIEIDGMDEPMTVNTSETENGNGSAVNATNQETPIRNSSIPLSSRPHLTGNILVRTPNTAQTQMMGVGAILSSSQGLDVNPLWIKGIDILMNIPGINNIAGDNLSFINSTHGDSKLHPGPPVCNFKGKEVHTHVDWLSHGGFSKRWVFQKMDALELFRNEEGNFGTFKFQKQDSCRSHSMYSEFFFGWDSQKEFFSCHVSLCLKTS